ncbi:hypothetical protein K437DRAFT_270143 [Tilletiaria anomala UBC 951]|uniref:Uncharacterized protein n=1 Tax=Tilletiaria anomala (strain ATCC 24038 / CBS 436.72 / UBC 951) TaxID=1037660 RepID=A0A066VMY9_TILAU|nr:uncharacterized protein K437DRAFT_270143 [Tilletiaria anomala UBC 951]KDN39920.1 hypothetical protein K437DRAFT_270143 [Tilletiaria anomala UBC 951]
MLARCPSDPHQPDVGLAVAQIGCLPRWLSKVEAAAAAVPRGTAWRDAFRIRNLHIVKTTNASLSPSNARFIYSSHTPNPSVRLGHVTGGTKPRQVLDNTIGGDIDDTMDSGGLAIVQINP